MVLFVSLLFSLAVFNELNFALADQTIYKYAALHSSSIQPYFADDSGRDSTAFDDTNAVKIWMLVRHGSRTAKDKENARFRSMGEFREQIEENYRKGLCASNTGVNWDGILNWEWSGDYDHEKELTASGEIEVKRIANIYRTKFPNFFQQIPFKASNFHMIYTNTSRTRDTAIAFHANATVSGAWNNIYKLATRAEEEMLKAYKDPLFEKKKKTFAKDGLVRKFFKSTEFKTVVTNVNARLGFGHVMETQRVMDMYNLCRYEGTWEQEKKSVWCSVFAKEELLVLEYAKDLESYSEYGPSDGLNKIVQCSTVLDMVNKLSERGGPKVTTYFTHSPAILLHLAAMGAYQAEKLSVSTYRESVNRKWKTSRISPMAANLAAVLHNHRSGKFVKFYLNGEVLYIPGCEGDLCSLDFIGRQIRANCADKKVNEITYYFEHALGRYV